MDIKYMSYFNLSTFMECQRKWKYSYVDKMQFAPDASFVEFMVFRAVLELNFLVKIGEKEDSELEMLYNAFEKEWAKHINGPDWSQEQQEESMSRCWEAIRTYMNEQAESIYPKEVNVPWGTTIEGVQITGRTNLKLTNGTMLDFSIGGQKPNQTNFEKNLKPLVIGMALGTPLTYVKHTVVMVKKPYVSHNTIHVTSADAKKAKNAISAHIQQMKAGIYTPNFGSFLCSRKNCPCYDICMEELSETAEDIWG